MSHRHHHSPTTTALPTIQHTPTALPDVLTHVLALFCSKEYAYDYIMPLRTFVLPHIPLQQKVVLAKTRGKTTGWCTYSHEYCMCRSTLPHNGQTNMMYYLVVHYAKVVAGAVKEEERDVSALERETSITENGVFIYHCATPYNDRPNYMNESNATSSVVTIVS